MVKVTFLAAGVTLVLSVAVVGQQRGGSAGTGVSPPSPDQFKQMVAQSRQMVEAVTREQLQHDLDISDDEMAVIWSKRQAVLDARYPALAGNVPLTPLKSLPPYDPQSANLKIYELQKALGELVQAEHDPAATPDQLADKMNDVRQLRRKNVADLQAAQDDLRKNLTMRQEGVCMVWGLLN